MSTEINNIELKSEEVQEILGHIPSKIIRYGITVVLSIVVVLFIGSFFFKYPDIISAPVEVLTQNPPAEIIARSSGNLTQIFVSDSQMVEVGQQLSVIQNSANYAHVAYFYKNINKIEKELRNPDLFSYLPDTLDLGDLQNTYSSFLTASQQYKQFVELNYYPKKQKALQQKQVELKKYAAIMGKQAKLHVQDYELVKNQFKRDSQLFEKEVISRTDFENAKKNVIQSGMSVQNAYSVVVNTQMSLQELAQQMVEYQLDESKELNGHYNTLNALYQNLESELAAWFDRYVLISPIAGSVAFNTVWNKNQYVEAGSQVFTVIPTGQQQVIGRVTLKSEGAGKVKVGQSVNLKFNNYPYQEFGMVQAKVNSISLLPMDNMYILELNLPDSLVTNYGITLKFSQKMPGVADIITEDLPLAVRLFNPLKAILKKHWAS